MREALQRSTPSTAPKPGARESLRADCRLWDRKSPRQIRDADPTHDTPDTRDQSAADDRRVGALHPRMARLLRFLPNPTCAHQSGSVDPPKITLVSLAAVAERAQPLQRTAPSRRTKVPGSGRRRLTDGVLADVRTPGGPTGPAQPLLPLARSPSTSCS